MKIGDIVIETTKGLLGQIKSADGYMLVTIESPNDLFEGAWLVSVSDLIPAIEGEHYQIVDGKVIDIRGKGNLNKAKRNNAGKLKWNLVDFKCLEGMVRVLEFGANKYGVDNWKKGLPATEVLESLIRHIVDLQAGITIDPESGEHQTGHILSNAMFLTYMYMKQEEQNETQTRR